MRPSAARRGDSIVWSRWGRGTLGIAQVTAITVLASWMLVIVSDLRDAPLGQAWWVHTLPLGIALLGVLALLVAIRRAPQRSEIPVPPTLKRTWTLLGVIFAPRGWRTVFKKNGNPAPRDTPHVNAEVAR